MQTADVSPFAAIGRRWLLRARIIHPFPTFLNVVAVVVLALIASGGRPEWGLVLRMAAVMLLVQCAIGATNDYCDRDLDALSNREKPLAAGVLSPGVAVLIGGSAVALAAVLAATLGLISWLLAMLGLSLGLLYNVRLKRTLLSAFPYIVAIPLLPVWVWVTVGARSGGVFWLLPLGALAGLSLHLMNALIDFEADRAGGVPGLAQRLGRRHALFVAWGSMGMALMLAGLLAPLLVSNAERVLIGVAVGLALLLTGMAIYRVMHPQPALRLNFGLLAVATVAAGAGWLSGL